MSFIKLVTEVVPKKTQVLVTHSQTPLAAEIIRQLKPHLQIDVIENQNPSDQFPQPDSLEVVIHLAGFGSPSLAETLSHTSVLHRLLTLAQSHKAKFILVVPNSHQHLYHTAITLVTQYAKNFPLSFQIIEVDKAASLPESASAIVKKFVYRHKTPANDPPQLPKTSTAARSTKSSASNFPGFKSVFMDFRRFLVFVIAALVASWALALISATLATIFFVCSIKTLPSARMAVSHTCARASNFSGHAASLLTTLAPGSSTFFAHLGFPLSHTLPVLESYTSAIGNLKILTDQTHLVYRSILSTNSAPPTQITTLESPISQTSESLAQLQTDLRELYQTSNRSHRLILSTAETVQSLHSLMSKLQLLLSPLDAQFTASENFVIAILIQDHTQLKATGGYLDTILLLTAKQGRLASVQVVPASAADAQLTGVADSPSDYRLATDQAYWQLRDSNWDPNFPTTASRVSWFLDKELSLTPSLIIAVNTSIFPNLLSVTGTQTFPDLGLTLSSQNFLAEYLSYLKDHSDASPLPSLTQSIFSKSLQFSDSQINQLMSVISHGLESGQILISPLTFNLPLPPLWSGEVGQPQCTITQPCTSDYLLPVTSNLSTNKTDAYVTTSAKLDIVVAPSKLTRHYSYLITHAGSSEWPSGDHSAYLRFYIPASSKLDSLLLDSQAVPTQDYNVSTSNGLLVVGLAIKTSPGQDSTVELRTSQDLATSSKFHYQLALPIQPGLISFPTTLAITYPPSWFISTYQTPTIAAPGRLEYNTPSQGHFQLNLDLNPVSN